MSTYKIVRHFIDKVHDYGYSREETVKDNVGLEEARKYLGSTEASSATCQEPENRAFVDRYGAYVDGYISVPEPPSDYSSEAADDAKEMVREFKDQIIEQILDGGEASTDYNNDYAGGDRYHHETHVDRSYNLQDAAELLSQLSCHAETDYGLWEGKDPEEAIACQAAFTYGNAVSAEWASLIESVNDDQEIEGLYDAYQELEGIDEEDFEDEDGNDMIEKAVKDAMGNLHKGEKTVKEGKAAVKVAIEARIEEIIS